MGTWLQLKCIANNGQLCLNITIMILIITAHLQGLQLSNCRVSGGVFSLNSGISDLESNPKKMPAGTLQK